MLDATRGRFSAHALWDVLVAVVAIGVMFALLVPYINVSRESARRMGCANQVKQLGLAIHNYEQANKALPIGTVCSPQPIQPSNQYDVWSEAASMEPGNHGTGFLWRILGFMESFGGHKRWDMKYGVAYNAHDVKYSDGSQLWTFPGLAAEDFQSFYCPSRRNALRPSDKAMMLDPSWKGGGTDYGGCAGRHAAFTNETGYNLCDATMHFEPDFQPKGPDGKLVGDDAAKRWGVFGRVNISTKVKEITDGTSNTILIGELQRITTISPGSKDGWAVGGPASLFTTGALVAFDGKQTRNVVPPTAGTPLNNMFWGSPGSEHPGGANIGMADGSVQFIATSIDPSVFALQGSMADETHDSD